jgi:hypothetical protein
MHCLSENYWIVLWYMPLRIIYSVLCLLLVIETDLYAQRSDSLYTLVGIVSDESFVAVPATHVINLHSHQGDVTDSLGIFRLQVCLADTLLIRNIAFRDTLFAVADLGTNKQVRIKRRRYHLQEARVFEWGATYDDFREAFIEMPMQQSLGASMGLPQQDPDKVPLEMDEEAIKSAGLLLSSPISFFYYNFNKHAKSARKVYWLKKNQTKHDQFNAIVSAENLSDISGLSGEQLEHFKAFLFQRMVCDINCSELAIYKEIHGLLTVYRELEERGMLGDE